MRVRATENAVAVHMWPWAANCLSLVYTILQSHCCLVKKFSKTCTCFRCFSVCYSVSAKCYESC